MLQQKHAAGETILDGVNAMQRRRTGNSRIQIPPGSPGPSFHDTGKTLLEFILKSLREIVQLREEFILSLTQVCPSSYTKKNSITHPNKTEESSSIESSICFHLSTEFTDFFIFSRLRGRVEPFIIKLSPSQYCPGSITT
jgi:hypothetical protein